MNVLNKYIKKSICSLFNCPSSISITLQQTKKEFEGDITLVVFPFVKYSQLSPQETAKTIGNDLIKNSRFINKFNVVKGFLNLSLDDSFYLKKFYAALAKKKFGFTKIRTNTPSIMIEFSSPNTNKPLHLGHIRNNLLGSSISKIIEASGKKTIKVQIINDRGIHICKSMVAWSESSKKEIPNKNKKGDKLVGEYYVKFNTQYEQEIKSLIKKGRNKEEAKEEAPILLKAKELLRKWENKDPSTIKLWSKMNNWVYSGLDQTYKRLGIEFDKNYYESETYLLGRDVIKKGVEKKIFYKKKDGSVWCNLSEKNLNDKLLLRSDGTSVYMTQDIGTAIIRFNDFNIKKQIYTVGNEQDYHFKVLFIILDKLGYKWASNCEHLSYGMINLPEGKMKSREGTIVDADELMEKMYDCAKQITTELGKVNNLTIRDKNKLYEIIGIGALKYFILKIDPKKTILFNPKESIDFNGNTGPFIQYTYARIKSILRKLDMLKTSEECKVTSLLAKEKELIQIILEYPNVINESAKNINPAIIANYTYQLVKKYNQFYQQVSILAAKNNVLIKFRTDLSSLTANVINSSMNLLGIQLPKQM